MGRASSPGEPVLPLYCFSSSFPPESQPLPSSRRLDFEGPCEALPHPHFSLDLILKEEKQKWILGDWQSRIHSDSEGNQGAQLKPMATPAYLRGGDGQRSCSTRSPGRNKCPYIPNTSFLKTGHRILLRMSKWTHHTWPDNMKVSSKLSCSYAITQKWWILYNLMNLNSPRKCHCLQWIEETSYIWHFVRKEIALQDHALKAIFSLVKTVLAKKKKTMKIIK